MVSAVAAVVTVLALRQVLQATASSLREFIPSSPPHLGRFATAAGVTSAIMLLAAGVMGAVAVAIAIYQAGRNVVDGQPGGMSVYLTLNAIVSMLGLAAVFANGFWYMLTSRAALRSNRLPKGLCYLGLALAIVSLGSIVPPLTLLALPIGLIWWAWLGIVMLRGTARSSVSLAQVQASNQ